MKKAVSPLIATVLLVAFAVSIGSIVMNEANKYIEQQSETSEITSNLKLKCSQDVYLEKLKLDNMKSYCYYNDSENLTISIKLRKGKSDLDGVRVSLSSNLLSDAKDYNKDISGTGFQINLGGFSKNLLKDGEIELIELVPYFLLDSGLKYMC